MSQISQTFPQGLVITTRKDSD